jgi:hypothetical protein
MRGAPYRALGLGVDRLDPIAQLGIGQLPGRGGGVLVPHVEGGTGDLEQPARPADVALLSLLRLDEREHVHRVS